jgi:aryl-alcohol dehydrogenase-like predicted oxidoreductase
MEKVRFGHFDEMVSPIGLGTVKIGRDQQVKYPDVFSIPDDKAVVELFETAKELGINLIDTAPAYGISEQRLGELLPGQRSDWHIATKVGEEFINGKSHFDFSAKHIASSVRRSLSRLKTDYLDTVLVHSDGNDVALIEQYGVLEVLQDLKLQGLIRFCGFSGKTKEGGLLALANSDVVMVTHNLDYQDELPVIEKAHELGKAVFIKKAFASGHITHGSKADAVKKSFQCIFKHPGVTSAVIGTISLKHLKENVELF